MSVALFTHPSMLDHEVPPGHPERPARLASVLKALEGMYLDRREAPLATRAQIELVHDGVYLDALDAAFPAPGERLVALDPDTTVSHGSAEAALRAAGAVIAAVDAVQGGEIASAFCAVRPPGHHAEPWSAMGFCLYNNAAIGALHAMRAHGLRRVAVMDFDVHHGNGTQTVATREPAMFYGSTHEHPFYPGTGAETEHGPAGNIVNAPLRAGADGAAFRRAMETRILPAIDSFAPDLIIISAGFDAHRADPLANLQLDESDYAWSGRALLEVARRHCGGRVVSTLEGGYDLVALGRSSAAFVEALRSG
ncbi:MAG TPA: histone deacetylase family protein [Caulobacterales bacterium]|jgi:acetoin utilization deacetylase AcuC-like enzyme|nr:histone deacetylase family protein [Caulobacterales bacterium]